MASFSHLPHSVTGSIAPFKLEVPDDAIQTLQLLLKISPIAPPNWENSHKDGRFGVSRDWLIEAVEKWKTFDWRKQEADINSIPNFKIEVADDDGRNYTVHFSALFSTKPDAIPIMFSHGWPGSFIEFLPLLFHIRNKFEGDASKLPYHIIVPSLIGYGLSGAPPQDKDFTIQDNARIFNKLMSQLGFGDGYVFQGGDVGSLIAQYISQYDSVKAAHSNTCITEPPTEPTKDLTEEDQEIMNRATEFRTHGMAYAMMHGTRPSTIGLALSSSPIALLAWLGEKWIEWTDETPSLDVILSHVSLWWYSGCYPTSIWPYRQVIARTSKMLSWSAATKPIGLSFFPKDIVIAPKSWLENDKRLAFFRAHEKGGHFAALEEPEILWQDVVDFISQTLR